jgi:hypothetical protein
MFSFLKKLFGFETEKTVEAPYKVEAPVAKAVSASVNPQITDAVTAPAPVVKNKPATEALKRGPKKKPAGQKPSAKPVVKPAAKKAVPKQGLDRVRKPKQAK